MLSASLVVSKYVLGAVVGFGWPVAIYVGLLATIGYGPSIWWCRLVSSRWGTGDLGADIGLSPRFPDLGWGPVIWLAAIVSQGAIVAVVTALGLPFSGNTEGMSEIRADRTYVVSIVVTAVIAAPIVEEMVFRGVVLRGLRSRLPIGLAIVLQGVLFGSAHVDPVRGTGNLGLVLVLSVVGIVFGTASVLLGRLGPSIVAHALFNGVVLLLVLTGVADRVRDDASGRVDERVTVQVHVVDQAHVADAYRRSDADVARRGVVTEPMDGPQGVGVEDRDVVSGGERLGGDDRLGGRHDRCHVEFS